MNDIQKKLVLFYKKITSKKETYEKRGIRPNDHWSVLLVISSVVFLVLAIFASYLYVQIKNNTIFTPAETNSLDEKKIEVQLLKKTVKDIEAREVLTNSIKNGEVTSGDPSL